LYWGTSEWAASQIIDAIRICEKFGLHPPLAEQPQYSLVARDRLENYEYTYLYKNYKYGTTIWSPLAGGLLTGKYNDGVPEDSRVRTQSDNPIIQKRYNEFFSEANKPSFIKKFTGLGEIAKELGITQAQLALAWVIKNKSISTAITSATRKE